jgi:Domain of unknown function/Domain of unknown function (DUF5013)
MATTSIKKLTAFLVCFYFIAALQSCKDQYEFRKYIKGGEITYAGKIDSVKVFSGHNRLKLEGRLNSDPKINSYTVYWASRRDSINVPINRENNKNNVTKIIEALEENIYNFEIRTFDINGNRSVPVYISGKVYGERYQKSLVNRPVLKNEYLGYSLGIDFLSIDLTSGAFTTEIKYTTASNETKTVSVPVALNNVVLDNYKLGSSYQYRTLFLPDPTCIDVFYTAYSTQTPAFQVAQAPFLKNASQPYERLPVWSGVRYGTPKEWIHNQAALNHAGYGAWDNQTVPSRFNLVSTTAEPLVNAKIYQKIFLAPGTYTLTVLVLTGLTYDAISDKAYFTVAKGGILPDVDVVEASTATLAFDRVNRTKPLTYTLNFTLTEITPVAIGVQTTNLTTVNRNMIVTSFGLVKN